MGINRRKQEPSSSVLELGRAELALFWMVSQETELQEAGWLTGHISVTLLLYYRKEIKGNWQEKGNK